MLFSADIPICLFLILLFCSIFCLLFCLYGLFNYFFCTHLVVSSNLGSFIEYSWHRCWHFFYQNTVTLTYESTWIQQHSKCICHANRRAVYSSLVCFHRTRVFLYSLCRDYLIVNLQDLLSADLVAQLVRVTVINDLSIGRGSVFPLFLR